MSEYYSIDAILAEEAVIECEIVLIPFDPSNSIVFITGF
jgi:hypothetical protein